MPGDITDVPKRIEGTTMYDSDRWLIDASYINLRSAALSYNLSRKYTTRFGLQNARVYLSGENLFISSKRKGLDPTQTYTGAPFIYIRAHARGDFRYKCYSLKLLK